MAQQTQEFPVISEWLKQQPLSILQLDAADRIVLFIADERDAIQKKTFTKWVNKHLIKHWIYTETYTCLHVCTEHCSLECDEVTKGVVDLFEDLRDGHNLISLLEVLSGEILPRERGRMRVHMLQNIQICLNFLKRRKIKLVNIRPDDIVDGNPKLTLGLIWTIILHFQLSDIVLHDDTQSFKEALLRWAQKTTEGYPGVRVTDFTQSWRDGLAFNAILHRNRPDLLDYRSCRGRTARENLENAFHIADRDLGVTRLLDPEDVDTPNPDEKSLITYISSLYELFPEPPEHNPLLDLERIRRIDEYKELASRLCVWMRESISRLRERNFPNTLDELKILQRENNRFRTEEIPPKLHDKQRLASSYKDIVKMVKALPGGHHRIEEDFKIENIEHQWNKLITAHQERDHAIAEEVNRLEKMHRLAEKLLGDIKRCDVRLDDIERQIVEEEKRVQRLHPLETKFNVEKIEADLRQEEGTIKNMFKDVQTLREGRYHKATELHNRVQQLHQRWADMKLEFQTRVVEALAARRAEALKKPLTEEELIASNPSFKFLHECILWVQEKTKKLEGLDFGHDLQSVKERLDEMKAEHRSIDQFQSKVDQCDRQKQQFKGEEYEVYTRMLNRLHKGYSELLVMSNKRMSDLDTLLDFVQSASNELKWLAEKEEVEVTRDWSSKSINLVEVEQYHRQLISDMERREHQFNVVQDRGESLIRQRHPATKCIEGLMARMQSQWSWLLQLINCLEAHSKNAADYHQFYNEARECDQWITKTEDKLNTTYSKQNFSIEEGEQLLKEMVRLKEDITRFGSVVSDLVSKSKDVVPLKQRKAALPRPIKARSVCLIKQAAATITKNETVTLHDNSQRSKWRVTTSSGSEVNAPGVCFVIPPPDQEAIDTANELKKRYEALVALWARKQHKLRQNMIFATLKIVKGWDYPTYCAMDPNQRDSIIRALEDDIDKLCREGPPDDPGSKRLRDEMDALRKKFAEFDARRRAEDEEKSNKALTKKYTDAADNLLERLIEKEKLLVQRCQNPIPRDRETLESLVVEHKEWEIDVKSYESEIQRVKELFHNIPQKTHTVQRNYDEILETWNRIWSLSQLYIERLKAVETVLLDIENATQVISNIEVRLASGDEMPADEVALRRVNNELIDSQNDIQRNKKTFDELNTSVNKVRRVVERTRPKAVTHSDVSRVEDDVKNLFKRWANCESTVIERLRSCEACADLFRSYKKRIDSDRSWLSQIIAKVNTLLARPDLDTTAKIYESLVERKSSIEDTNSAGGRFIREAKIYDLKIKSFRDSLEDSHPSLDASAKISRRTPGADIVAEELDQLNKEYSELLDAVSKLLSQVRDDTKLQEKMLITRISFKTYRTDLGLAVNQTSNQLLDFNNDFNTNSMTTTTTTSSNQQIGQLSPNSELLTDRMSAKTCKTTSSLVMRSSDLDSRLKKSIEIEQRLTQFMPSDQTDYNMNEQTKPQTHPMTFSKIISTRRLITESTETDEMSLKRETSTRSTSSSPSTPKKARSASEIVRESMSSKRITNRVETSFDRKSRSPTKHTSVEITSHSEISTTSDKSESSPERMSYSSGSSPTRSQYSSKDEFVSHKTRYKSDSDSKSRSSSGRTSPEKETSVKRHSFDKKLEKVESRIRDREQDINLSDSGKPSRKKSKEESKDLEQMKNLKKEKEAIEWEIKSIKSKPKERAKNSETLMTLQKKQEAIEREMQSINLKTLEEKADRQSVITSKTKVKSKQKSIEKDLKPTQSEFRPEEQSIGKEGLVIDSQTKQESIERELKTEFSPKEEKAIEKKRLNALRQKQEAIQKELKAIESKPKSKTKNLEAINALQRQQKAIESEIKSIELKPKEETSEEEDEDVVDSQGRPDIIQKEVKQKSKSKEKIAEREEPIDLQKKQEPIKRDLKSTELPKGLEQSLLIRQRLSIDEVDSGQVLIGAQAGQSPNILTDSIIQMKETLDIIDFNQNLDKTESTTYPTQDIQQTTERFDSDIPEETECEIRKELIEINGIESIRESTSKRPMVSKPDETQHIIDFNKQLSDLNQKELEINLIPDKEVDVKKLEQVMTLRQKQEAIERQIQSIKLLPKEKAQNIETLKALQKQQEAIESEIKSIKLKPKEQEIIEKEGVMASKKVSEEKLIALRQQQEAIQKQLKSIELKPKDKAQNLEAVRALKEQQKAIEREIKSIEVKPIEISDKVKEMSVERDEKTGLQRQQEDVESALKQIQSEEEKAIEKERLIALRKQQQALEKELKSIEMKPKEEAQDLEAVMALQKQREAIQKEIKAIELKPKEEKTEEREQMIASQKKPEPFESEVKTTEFKPESQETSDIEMKATELMPEEEQVIEREGVNGLDRKQEPFGTELKSTEFRPEEQKSVKKEGLKPREEEQKMETLMDLREQEESIERELNLIKSKPKEEAQDLEALLNLQKRKDAIKKEIKSIETIKPKEETIEMKGMLASQSKQQPIEGQLKTEFSPKEEKAVESQKLLGLRQQQQAIQMQLKAIELNPKDMAQNLETVEALQKQQEAIEREIKSIELKPEEEEINEKEGVMASKKTPEEKAIEKEKLVGLRQQQQAIQMQLKAIELKPKDKAQNIETLKALQKQQEAIESEIKSIELKPKEQEIIKKEGVMASKTVPEEKTLEKEKLIALQQQQEAIQKQLKSIESKPKDKAQNLEAVKALKEQQEAIEREIKSIELKPEKEVKILEPEMASQKKPIEKELIFDDSKEPVKPKDDRPIKKERKTLETNLKGEDIIEKEGLIDSRSVEEDVERKLKSTELRLKEEEMKKSEEVTALSTQIDVKDMKPQELKDKDSKEKYVEKTDELGDKKEVKTKEPTDREDLSDNKSMDFDVSKQLVGIPGESVVKPTDKKERKGSKELRFDDKTTDIKLIEIIGELEVTKKDMITQTMGDSDHQKPQKEITDSTEVQKRDSVDKGSQKSDTEETADKSVDTDQKLDKDREMVSLETSVDKGFIDLDAVIHSYDSTNGSTKSIRVNIRGDKNGHQMESQSKSETTNGTQIGLRAVMGAPILAAHSIAGPIRQKTSESKTSQTDDSPPVPQKRTASIELQTEVTKQDMSTSTSLSTSELNAFSDTEAAILAWIQEMESRLNRYRVLSVYVEQLREQVAELSDMAEEIHSHESEVSDIVRHAQELIRHSSGGDSFFIKDKLDALQSRFSELTHRTSDKLNQAKEALPIAQKFHSDHNQLNQWMDEAEREIKNLGSLNLNAQEKAIKKLESQIPDNRNLLESINHLGPKLSVISPGQGAATIEGFVTRASRRFYAICEQIQRKAERTELLKQRINEVITDIDELLDWFRDAERQLLEAEPITPNPEALAILLKETKALYDDINSQKGRVRDVITNAKKSMRESSDEDLAHIRDKAEDLKELANHVSQLCQDRLNALEQALPLAEHFFEAHSELSQWLDEAESEAQMLGKPAIHAPQIRRQQETTKALLQSVAEHKPLIDKLNKTGAALMRLIFEEDARQVQKIIDSDNDRYNRLRNMLREQQNLLEAALQATSQFVDKLDGMLNSLNNTADQLRNAEPIAAHPDRIQEQIFDNNAILNDLDQRADAVAAIKSAARDVISKAGKSDEPAIRDIKNKLNKLNDLWDEVQKNAKNRGRSLDDALKVAEKFWNELNNVMKAIRDLQDTLNSQEPPASEPNEIKQQQNQLKEIKHDMDQTKPEVERTKKTGRDLMQLCGEPDKPEVKKHIEDLDNAWDNVTSLYAKREQNLIDAMEKAMNFHEMLKNLLDFLGKAERKYDSLGPIAADIDTVKKQIRDLKEFQNEVNPHMVEVEALNRQAHELLEDVSPDQARSIRGPVDEINRRWDDLLKNIVERQNDLDNALLRLGQFQHALSEFLAWITKTERTLDEMRPVFGDPPVIEVELAKHKVLMNDIQAHQTSLDTLNIAGKQMMASERGTESARTTQSKLNDLNSRWEQLLDKAHQRQRELEEALREAQAFNQEIQDLLIWLNDVDQQLSSSKPVGGLPETAREQLNRFMELFGELESARPKVESTLKQGEDYLRRSTEGAATNLQHNLKTLRQRWENVLSRANDRKIKLEIALREATEFHEALQEFVDWLTSSEKYLSNLQPVSRVVDHVLQQIEEHKHFQKDIGAHRETMLNLDKKGTHLKYFSQKQDVILIKNLLVSVQHRWERVVSKAAERTRALDHGFKEAKEFSDAWSDLISWLNDAEKTLDSIQQMGNNPEFIKQMLSRHKEFQRSLGAKQSTYDSTIKMGRTLKEKAPKPDIPILQEMLDELKNKWNSVCNKSVDRQRKLEEALLYSGQFKDAIQALIDWLDKAKRELAIDQPVHGDLDTVTALVDQHKSFQEDFKSRAKNLQSVRKTASDLLQTATSEDARHIKEQMNLLDNKWDEVSRLSDLKKEKLDEALKLAEQLHKSVHMLLEWLSDAEMKLRFAGPLPEDEATTRQQIAEHERFMREMSSQEKNKDSTISLAQEILQKCHPDATPVIRHWITIIQSRWEEVSAWAQQREQRLQDHLRSLRNIMDLLEELLAWLIGAEASLLAAEAQPLPDDVLSLERLIEEHQRFIDDMIRREPDVEKVAKAFSTKRTVREQVSRGFEKGRTRGLPPRTSTPTRGHVEPEIKHPRARELLEKWRVVWKLAMDRMKRLQDKLNYNRELDRMRNFDFDEWRRRFLGWMNNKKARIMDFFRNIDTDNDGKVTKSEFIEGFLASKFPTSRLEMDRVADIFDRNNDGYIDQKEYLDTLRPDRDQPKTEAEIIQDEVQRLVNKCTCLVRYKVFQVGEGRYRFGESQKLRLVRILRSTVMVRVGGGWVSLDEFLIKNDPCRAKGRTNVELREQFILADGVSQSMASFKSKSPIKPDGTINTTGPITKIREKSERSVPMGQQHHYRYGNSTSDYSFSDQHDSSGASKGRPRSRLTIGSGSKPNSTPGSRHSSRPASRASSDMSVESLEGYQQRKTTTTTRSKLSFTGSRTNGTNGTRERWK